MKIIETVKTKYGVRRRVAIRFEDHSLADGSQKEDCDINNIVKKFMKTRDNSIFKQREGVYADVSNLGDLSDSYEKIQLAEEAFASVPAELRKKLNNDPVKFVEFLNDPKNDDEAVKYGLKSRRQTENLDNHSPLPTPTQAKAKTKSKPAQTSLPTEDEE